MAIRSMWSTLVPGSGQSVTGGSILVAYDDTKIVWPTLASKVGTTASSSFSYIMPSGENGRASVKHSVTNIFSAFSVTQVS
jgi:hypothetical protein